MDQVTVSQPVSDRLLAFQKYQHQFVNYLRNPINNPCNAETLPERSSVYAKLLFRKIEGSLDTCFPITHELLGSEIWQQLIRTFIRDHRCQSPLYREIPDEFIAFLMTENLQIKLPDYLLDLAHFEWMELVLETSKNSETDVCLSLNEDLLTIVPALNSILYLLHYRYPVQTIRASDPFWKSWATRCKPYPQEATTLAGLRDRCYQIHFIELNAVTARLVELLQERIYTGEQALLQLAIEMNYDAPETILPFGINTLNQLKEQKIIIGAQNG